MMTSTASNGKETILSSQVTKKMIYMVLALMVVREEGRYYSNPNSRTCSDQLGRQEVGDNFNNGLVFLFQSGHVVGCEAIVTHYKKPVLYVTFSSFL